VSSDVLLVSLYCSSTGHPQVGKFTLEGADWALVGVSRQRPGVAPPREGGRELGGSFCLSSSYRGCPSCHASSFMQCGRCSRLVCWDPTWERYSCPHCKNSGRVSGTIEKISTLGPG
jgi:hypothetical protein